MLEKVAQDSVGVLLTGFKERAVKAKTAATEDTAVKEEVRGARG